MSHLPFIFDYDDPNQSPIRYAVSIRQNGLFENIDTSTLEYYPKLGRSKEPNKDRFEVYLDVEDFLPEDIRVKTLRDFVVITGKHEEKRDVHGWVSRQFQRRCPIPKGHKIEGLLSQYSSDGTLAITGALIKNDDCDLPVKKTEDKDNNQGNKNEGNSSNESNKNAEPKDGGDDQSKKKPTTSKLESDFQMIEVNVDTGGENSVRESNNCSLEEFLRGFTIDDVQD